MADNGNNSSRLPVNRQQQYWKQRFDALDALHKAQQAVVDQFVNLDRPLTQQETQRFADATRRLLEIEYETNQWIRQGWQDPDVFEFLVDNPDYREYEIKNIPVGDYIYNNYGQPPRYAPQSLSGQLYQAGREAVTSAVEFVQGAQRGFESFVHENEGTIRVLIEHTADEIAGAIVGRFIRIPRAAGSSPLADRLAEDLEEQLGTAAVAPSDLGERTGDAFLGPRPRDESNTLEPHSDARGALDDPRFSIESVANALADLGGQSALANQTATLRDHEVPGQDLAEAASARAARVAAWTEVLSNLSGEVTLALQPGGGVVVTDSTGRSITVNPDGSVQDTPFDPRADDLKAWSHAQAPQPDSSSQYSAEHDDPSDYDYLEVPSAEGLSAEPQSPPAWYSGNNAQANAYALGLQSAVGFIQALQQDNELAAALSGMSMVNSFAAAGNQAPVFGQGTTARRGAIATRSVFAPKWCSRRRKLLLAA